MFNALNFGSRVMSDFIYFDVDMQIPLSKQTSLLKKRLIVVYYEDGYIFHVGWHPEFNVDGEFILQVIQQYNWEEPLEERRCKDLQTLIKYINELVVFIEEHRRQHRIHIDWGNGVIDKIVYDLDFDVMLPLDKQLDSLKEDILSIKYKGDYSLDVGWYPEFNLNGRFVIVVIKDGNYEEPLETRECNSLSNLIKCINELVFYIQSR